LIFKAKSTKNHRFFCKNLERKRKKQAKAALNLQAFLFHLGSMAQVQTSKTSNCKKKQL